MTALTMTAALEQAREALLGAIEDSRREYAADLLLDLAEEMTADEILRDCERASLDEYGAAMMAALFATLKAHAAAVGP